MLENIGIRGKINKQFFLNNGLYVVLLALIGVIAMISPKFFSLVVLRDILMQSSTRIIVALGCMFILIAAGADLSGGRMVGFAAVISGSLAQASTYSNPFFSKYTDLPIWIPVLVSILVGLVIGMLNGYIVAKLSVPAFIATLGTSMFIYGLNSLYFNLPPNNSQPLGGYQKAFTELGAGSIAGIPYITLIALGCMLFVFVLMNKTCLGKEIYAVGGNEEAAKFAGINIIKVQLFVYSMAGIMYALAGMLEAARTGSATSNYGAGYELDAIASCIVGGCSITGGVGTVQGVFVGVIIFNVISYGLTFIGVSSYWQNVIKGIIIVAAVALDVRKYKTKK